MAGIDNIKNAIADWHRWIDHGLETDLDWQALLRTAIESSSHGLCIFDNQLRLVIANEHHRNIYGLAQVQTLAGTPDPGDSDEQAGMRERSSRCGRSSRRIWKP